MFLSLSPIRQDAALAVFRDGDRLTLNDVVYDFTRLPQGGTLPRSAVDCPFLASDVVRQEDDLHLTLTLPHGPDASADMLFPDRIHATDGPVKLPGHEAAAAQGSVDGHIDWDAMLDRDTVEQSRIHAVRASREVARLDLLMALVSSGLVSQTSAIQAASGAMPPEFEPLLEQMTATDQLETRLRWAAAPRIGRLSPLMLMLQQQSAMDDRAMDDLFGLP